MRTDSIAPGQSALVHGVLNQFDDGIVHALGMDALVFRTSPLGQGVQRRLQRRSAFGVENAVDGKHAV